MRETTIALSNWTVEQRGNGYWYYGDTYGISGSNTAVPTPAWRQ